MDNCQQWVIHRQSWPGTRETLQVNPRTSTGSSFGVSIQQRHKCFHFSDAQLECVEWSDIVSTASLHQFIFLDDDCEPERNYRNLIRGIWHCLQHDLLLACECDKRRWYKRLVNDLVLHDCTAPTISTNPSITLEWCNRCLSKSHA